FFKSIKFALLPANPCLFTNQVKNLECFVNVYKLITTEFCMENIGELNCLLGVKLLRFNDKALYLGRSILCNQLLKINKLLFNCIFFFLIQILLSVSSSFNFLRCARLSQPHPLLCSVPITLVVSQKETLCVLDFYRLEPGIVAWFSVEIWLTYLLGLTASCRSTNLNNWYDLFFKSFPHFSLLFYSPYLFSLPGSNRIRFFLVFFPLAKTVPGSHLLFHNTHSKELGKCISKAEMEKLKFNRKTRGDDYEKVRKSKNTSNLLIPLLGATTSLLLAGYLGFDFAVTCCYWDLAVFA
ncbi:uncharacterized protein VP01_378g6, partial [Puccinia sorghi]